MLPDCTSAWVWFWCNHGVTAYLFRTGCRNGNIIQKRKKKVKKNPSLDHKTAAGYLKWIPHFRVLKPSSMPHGKRAPETTGLTFAVRVRDIVPPLLFKPSHPQRSLQTFRWSRNNNAFSSARSLPIGRRAETSGGKPLMGTHPTFHSRWFKTHTHARGWCFPGAALTRS